MTRTSGARAVDRRARAARARNWSTIASLMRSGAEPGVADAVDGAGEVDRQGAAGAEVLAPVDRRRAVAYSSSASAAGPLTSGSRTRSADPRPQAGAVRGLERAGEGDAGADLLHARCAERRSSPASSDSRPRGTVAKRGRSVITQGYHAADRGRLR